MALIQQIDLDAWSIGQTRSKLWLCEELEKLQPKHFGNATIWILGAWYATTAFFLFCRNRLQIEHIRSFDLDPLNAEVAESLNKAWVQDNSRFKAFVANIEELNYQSSELYQSTCPNIVVNTACEHMASKQWFNIIPHGRVMVLQSTHLEHHDHVSRVTSAEELKEQLPLTKLLYSGTLTIEEPHRTYQRFMTIGIK